MPVDRQESVEHAWKKARSGLSATIANAYLIDNDLYLQLFVPTGFAAQVVTFDRERCVLYKQALDQYLTPEVSDVVMSVISGEKQYSQYRGDRDAEEKLLARFRDPNDPLKIVTVTSKLLTASTLLSSRQGDSTGRT